MAFEDVLYSSSITAADIDIGDTLIFSAPLPLPTWLLFDDATQVLSGTPGNDEVGYHSVTLRVSDGTVNVDTTFTIRVANENDAPTFTSMPDTVALEDALYTSTVTASDMDGDTLIFSAPVLPDWLLFDVATQVLSGTPGNDEVGFHSVTLSVYDGTVTLDSTFAIRVANENDAPTFTSIPITTGQQGTLYTYAAIAEDIDGDNLVFSAPVLPIWLDFDTETHVLSGTPDNGQTGNQSVSLMINDGTVDVFQSFVIDVENVNDPPSITSTPVTEARPGVAYEYTVTAVDIDGDALTYTARVLPGWLTFNPSTQLLSATPSDQDIGDQHVSIRVSDGSLYVDHNFVITVSSANHAPTFTSDPTTSVVIGDSYVYTITANDIDGDALTYSAPVLPDWLTLHTDTHVIDGVPSSGDLGRHDVTLRVSDGTVSA
ncbi:MAG: putative Ig domain-containing protein, partial [Bacteroidales bacterium]|nr:putative Ig domain-containing protein [Bacteroidales bacterium]